MSIIDDIMGNIDEYPELGELIPDNTDKKTTYSVLDWIEGKSKRPAADLTENEIVALKNYLNKVRKNQKPNTYNEKMKKRKARRNSGKS